MKSYFKIKIVIVSLFAIGFCGCLSTKKFTKFVNEGLNNEIPKLNKLISKSVSFSHHIVYDSNKLCEVKKISSYFIPAIFYWGTSNVLECSINPNVPIKIFEDQLVSFTDSVGLDSILRGRRIELSITQLPNSFVLEQGNSVIILMVAYSVSAIEQIYLIKKDLEVKYRIIEEGKEDITGILVVPSFDDAQINRFNGTQKFTKSYIKYYKNNCNYMSYLFCKRMLKILQS